MSIVVPKQREKICLTTQLNLILHCWEKKRSGLFYTLQYFKSSISVVSLLSVINPQQIQ